MRLLLFQITIGFVVLAAGLLLACDNNSGNGKTADREPTINKSTPIVPPPETNRSVVQVTQENQPAESLSHEKLYKRKSYLLFVLKRLTQLNEKFMKKEPSVSQHIKREKEIFSLIDALSDDVIDLVTLAKASRTLEIHGRGFNRVVSPFDIAFLRCVKILATTHKDVEGVTIEIEELKKFQVDGHLAEEFTMALEGKDPSFLYSKIDKD